MPTGFQLKGQIPLEDFRKIRAPKGKFIVVERSANNVTGWGYTRIGVYSSKKSAFLKMDGHQESLGTGADVFFAAGRVTMGGVISSISLLVVDSKGKVLKEYDNDPS